MIVYRKKALVLAALMAGCMVFAAGLSAQQYFTPSPETSGITAAIGEVKTVGSAGELASLAIIIRNTLTTDFRQCSDLTLVDMANLQQILEMQSQSASGNFSDEDYIKMGDLTNAHYSVFSTLTSLDTGKYILSMRVTNNDSGEIQASYTSNPPVGRDSIEYLGAIRQGSLSLLRQLGVKLTEEGVAYLQNSDEGTEQASQDMARQALQDKDYMKALRLSLSGGDSASAESIRLEALQGVEAGAAGKVIKQDFQAQQDWKRQLSQFETIFTEQPPFTLYYTPVPNDSNRDYDTETVDYDFYVSLRPDGVKVMQQMLDTVNKTLNKTGKRKDWGFANWPAIAAGSTKNNQIPSPLLNNYRTYRVKAGLYDRRDRLIKDIEFDMYSQLALSGKKINYDSTQKSVLSSPGRKITISGVDYTQLPDGDVVVKIIGVTDPDGEPVYLPQTAVTAPETAAADTPAQADSAEAAADEAEAAANDAVQAMKEALRGRTGDDESAGETETETEAEAADAEPAAPAVPVQPPVNIAVKAVVKMPAVLASMPKDKSLIPELPEDARVRADKEAALSQKEQEKLAKAKAKAEKAAQKAEEKRQKQKQYELEHADDPVITSAAEQLDKRIGVSGTAAIFPGRVGTTSLYASVEGGIGALSLEGVFSTPFKGTAYGEFAERPISFGGGIGLTGRGKNAFFGVTGGYTYVMFDNEALHVPYAKVTLDILPWKWLLGIRVGYMVDISIKSGPDMEKAANSADKAYANYFKDAYKAGDLRLLGKVFVGLVFWL